MTAMQSSIIKYGIFLVGVLFLLSTAEVSDKESQQYYHTECHVFVRTDNVILPTNTANANFALTDLTLLYIGFAALHNSHDAIETSTFQRSQNSPLDIPLYLSVSSLRI